MDKATEMHIFTRVVEQGGFSAAARHLKLTPSAVSKQITRLEDRLGIRLLNRTTRRLSLTEEGKAFYERSSAILGEIEDAELAVSDARDQPRGTLKINAPVAFGRRQLVPLLPEFMRRYPELRIELDLIDQTVNLLEEGIDVLIRAVAELGDSSHVARKLASASRVVCAAPDYIRRHGKPKTPDALRRHNCLLFNHPSSINDWNFKDGQQGISQTKEKHVCTHSLQTAQHLYPVAIEREDASQGKSGNHQRQRNPDSATNP